MGAELATAVVALLATAAAGWSVLPATAGSRRKVGGRGEIVIPPRLGCRNHATGRIKANETRVLVVDLVSVRS